MADTWKHLKVHSLTLGDWRWLWVRTSADWLEHLLVFWRLSRKLLGLPHNTVPGSRPEENIPENQVETVPPFMTYLKTTSLITWPAYIQREVDLTSVMEGTAKSHYYTSKGDADIVVSFFGKTQLATEHLGTLLYVVCWLQKYCQEVWKSHQRLEVSHI